MTQELQSSGWSEKSFLSSPFGQLQASISSEFISSKQDLCSAYLDKSSQHAIKSCKKPNSCFKLTERTCNLLQSRHESSNGLKDFSKTLIKFLFSDLFQVFPLVLSGAIIPDDGTVLIGIKAQGLRIYYFTLKNVK